MKLNDILLERKFSKPIYAYHATKGQHLRSILKHGLIPNKESGGYGSDSFDYSTKLSLDSLSGVYFTKDVADVKEISWDMPNAIIIVAKIQQETAEADEDELPQCLDAKVIRDKIHLYNDGSENWIDEFTKSQTLTIVNLLSKNNNIDTRAKTSLEPAIYDYVVNLMNYFKDSGDNKKSLETEVRKSRNKLTKILRKFSINQNDQRFKINQLISFSGANRIVGIYIPKANLGWGDVGEFKHDKNINMLDSPQEFFKYKY